MKSNQRVICIDARFWGIKDTGIGRYTQNLIASLPHSKDIRIVIFVSPATAAEPSLARFEKYIIPHHPYTLASFFETHLALFKIDPDLFHATNLSVPVFWPGKIIVTIHDLIKHFSRGLANTTRHPAIYWLKYLEYRILVFLAIRRAAHIIVPAMYWKDILISKYHRPPGSISVTYEGVTPGYSFKVSPLMSIPPYLVYTGNLYPHKNVGVLIQAAEKLKIPVKIICARTVFANRLPRSEYVLFLGRLTDAEIIRVYQGATAFVFPSLIEGFGLPGLEAMAAGCPVIAASTSCLPEIYGSAAIYFNPHDPQDLADKIITLLGDPKLRQEYITRGKLRAKKYSWAKMARETWQIYQKELL